MFKFAILLAYGLYNSKLEQEMGTILFKQYKTLFNFYVLLIVGKERFM